MGRANQVKDCRTLRDEDVLQVPLLDVTRAPAVVVGETRGFGNLSSKSNDLAPMKETPPREGKSTQKEQGARTES